MRLRRLAIAAGAVLAAAWDPAVNGVDVLAVIACLSLAVGGAIPGRAS